MTEHEVPIYKL